MSSPAEIRVASSSDGTGDGPADGTVAAHARQLLAEVVTTGFHDDRFDTWPPSPGFVAALATAPDTGRPLGYLGGAPDRDRFRLDALVSPGAPAPAAVLGELYLALTPHRGGGDVEVWGRPAGPPHTELAATQGLAELRALHQMRCRLPIEGAARPLETRPYRPHDDLEALRLVNNRAFATHPDQGAKTADELLATMAEPWFDPEGLRLHEREGRLAGFCWTKIHRHPSGGTDAGEIFVIGIDPDFWGKGLGVPMTASGLDWLAAQGLTTGMLFVEADNTPAIRTYERLGFDIVRTDRAWLARP